MRGLGSAACLSYPHKNKTRLADKLHRWICQSQAGWFLDVFLRAETCGSRDATAIFKKMSGLLARCSRIRSSRIGSVAWIMMSCPSFAKRRGTQQISADYSPMLTTSHHFWTPHPERWTKAMQLVDDDDIMSTAGSRDAGVTAEEQQCQCSSPSRALLALHIHT